MNNKAFPHNVVFDEDNVPVSAPPPRSTASLTLTKWIKYSAVKHVSASCYLLQHRGALRGERAMREPGRALRVGP